MHTLWRRQQQAAALRLDLLMCAGDKLPILPGPFMRPNLGALTLEVGDPAICLASPPGTTPRMGQVPCSVAAGGGRRHLCMYMGGVPRCELQKRHSTAFLITPPRCQGISSYCRAA